MHDILQAFQRSLFSSALTQCNGKRDHDHAGKGKIEIHEVFHPDYSNGRHFAQFKDKLKIRLHDLNDRSH
ncbi:hypothetical protein V0M98_14175 [Pseudomonas silesiensis]|uniref:hypothetical protein n=1 Tax=Pseudomonas silesiensis TaxID=1853130 RepID=UPI0030CC9AEC